MRNIAGFLRFLPFVFVLVFAATVGLTFRKHDARPLNSEVLNSAQIARNITKGRGFSTDLLQEQDNLNVLSKPFSNTSPELLQAPLYPSLLALVFSVFGESDGVITGFSLTLLVASALLLFVLARRLLDQTALPLIIAAAYAVSLSVLGVANAGQPQILGSCLLLLLLLNLTARQQDGSILSVGDETESSFAMSGIPPSRHFSRFDFGIGVLAALCYLNDYLSVFAIFPLLLLWRPRKQWARGAIFAFALGFSLAALPWWIRNVRLTGNPLHSQEWLLLSGQAGSLSQWWAGLPLRATSFLGSAATLPHLLLAPFVLISLWIRPRSALLGRREMAILLSLLIFIAALSAFGRQSPADLMPFASLLSLVGFITFQRILSSAWQDQAIGKKMVRSLLFEPSANDPTFYEAVPSKANNSWRFQALRLNFLRWLRLPIWLRKSDVEETLFSGRYSLQSVFEVRSAALLTALLTVPWLGRVAFSPVAAPDKTRATISSLTKVVPQNRVVVTDSPYAVAWYSNRRAMLLPDQAASIISPEASNVGALYLSGQLLDERLRVWQPLFNGAQVPGFERVPSSSKNVLYLRQPSLEESRRVVKTNPKNAAASLTLGQLLLQRNQPREALTQFVAVQRSQPKRSGAFSGSGFALMMLKNWKAAEPQFATALRLSPRSLPALLGMAQVQQAKGDTNAAIVFYERALADNPEDPVALNNLAQLYADQKTSLYRALAMARRAANRNPNNSSMLDTLGWTCWRLGYREEALRYVQQAAKLAPDNKNIVSHLKQVRGK